MQNPATAHHRAKERNSNTTSILPPTLAQTQALEAQQLSLFAPNEAIATVSIIPCPSCGTTQGKQIAGKGPHHAGLRCASCNRFIRWLPKPKSGGAA